VSTSHPDLALPVPEYILDHDDPAALFSRLQRVVIHLELLQNEAVRDFDISFRDFVILATLRKEPAPHELPVTQIARYVLRPMGSISQGLDRVEDAGLITRAPARDDRRKVLVRLTTDGERFADEVLAAYDLTRKRVFDRLTGDQTERIDAAVTDLLSALDNDYADGDSP
jgi:DNA-binding MarR family transcriptional regulator